jgi:hypothetical protein
MLTEFYDHFLLISHPRAVCDAWVPYAFVGWLEPGRKFNCHRFPELDTISLSSEAEALSLGFSTARAWANGVLQSGIGD